MSNPKRVGANLFAQTATEVSPTVGNARPKPKRKRNAALIEQRDMQGVRVWLNRHGLTVADADAFVFKTKTGFAFYRKDLLKVVEQRKREQDVKKAQQFMTLLHFHLILARTHHD